MDLHPEKRLKAAYKKYEDVNLPILKQENPNMKLSQLKQMLWKDWQKSPDNPLNQRLAASWCSHVCRTRLVSVNSYKDLGLCDAVNKQLYWLIKLYIKRPNCMYMYIKKYMQLWSKFSFLQFEVNWKCRNSKIKKWCVKIYVKQLHYVAKDKG